MTRQPNTTAMRWRLRKRPCLLAAAVGAVAVVIEGCGTDDRSWAVERCRARNPGIQAAEFEACVDEQLTIVEYNRARARAFEP